MSIRVVTFRNARSLTVMRTFSKSVAACWSWCAAARARARSIRRRAGFVWGVSSVGVTWIAADPVTAPCADVPAPVACDDDDGTDADWFGVAAELLFDGATVFAGD